MNKRIYKKSAKNNIKRRRKSTRNHRKKMRGGVTFNSPIDSFRPIPPNTYENDPSRDVTTARTLPFSQFGGKTKRKRGKRGKKMKRKVGTKEKKSGKIYPIYRTYRVIIAMLWLLFPMLLLHLPV